MKIPAMPTPERIEEVSNLRAQGMTYAEIGRQLGISRQRVGQIIEDAPLQVEMRVTPVGVLISADADPDTLADRLTRILEGLGKMRVRRRHD